MGCKTKLQRDALAKHEESCGFQPMNCRHSGHGCQEKFPRNNTGRLKAHEEGCRFKRHPCRYY